MISPRATFNGLTVKQLKEEVSRLGIKVERNIRKEGLVTILCRYWRHWDIRETYFAQNGTDTLTPRQARRFQKAVNRSLGTTGIRKAK